MIVCIVVFVKLENIILLKTLENQYSILISREEYI